MSVTSRKRKRKRYDPDRPSPSKVSKPSGKQDGGRMTPTAISSKPTIEVRKQTSGTFSFVTVENPNDMTTERSHVNFFERYSTHSYEFYLIDESKERKKSISLFLLEDLLKLYPTEVRKRFDIFEFLQNHPFYLKNKHFFHLPLNVLLPKSPVSVKSFFLNKEFAKEVMRIMRKENRVKNRKEDEMPYLSHPEAILKVFRENCGRGEEDDDEGLFSFEVFEFVKKKMENKEFKIINSITGILKDLSDANRLFTTTKSSLGSSAINGRIFEERYQIKRKLTPDSKKRQFSTISPEVKKKYNLNHCPQFTYYLFEYDDTTSEEEEVEEEEEEVERKAPKRRRRRKKRKRTRRRKKEEVSESESSESEEEEDFEVEIDSQIDAVFLTLEEEYRKQEKKNEKSYRNRRMKVLSPSEIAKKVEKHVKNNVFGPKSKEINVPNIPSLLYAYVDQSRVFSSFGSGGEEVEEVFFLRRVARKSGEGRSKWFYYLEKKSKKVVKKKKKKKKKKKSSFVMMKKKEYPTRSKKKKSVSTQSTIIPPPKNKNIQTNISEVDRLRTQKKKDVSTMIRPLFRPVSFDKNIQTFPPSTSTAEIQSMKPPRNEISVQTKKQELIIEEETGKYMREKRNQLPVLFFNHNNNNNNKKTIGKRNQLLNKFSSSSSDAVVLEEYQKSERSTTELIESFNTSSSRHELKIRRTIPIENNNTLTNLKKKLDLLRRVKVESILNIDNFHEVQSSSSLIVTYESFGSLVSKLVEEIRKDNNNLGTPNSTPGKPEKIQMLKSIVFKVSEYVCRTFLLMGVHALSISMDDIFYQERKRRGNEVDVKILLCNNFQFGEIVDISPSLNNSNNDKDNNNNNNPTIISKEMLVSMKSLFDDFFGVLGMSNLVDSMVVLTSIHNLYRYVTSKFSE